MDEESLFAAALEKPTAAERRAFLAETCGRDVRLRQRLEQLLAADEHTRGLLDRGPAPADLLAACRAEVPLTTEQLFAGRFLLRQKIGEGGMGEVWVADQTEPVQRRVALKVIRPGFDSARLLARFDQERQTLALMDHPNIAKVLDAGVVGGRPYFVMDLIHGVPITRYCDEARVSPRHRLELFILVCQAVQHAHQKGVIHRDIKPTNVLVTEIDGKPVPKVIDFGIAKATGPQSTEHSASTEVGTLVGTLEYMSPEQADLDGVDVDTRSDIYALGVVLYELLTGCVPFSREQLQATHFSEMLRIIKEVEPPKPSTRLSVDTSGVAAARQTESRKLAALVRGELDWIVMKALEKEPDRRYESANGLAADVQRYLADEPVLAGPPSTRYRVGKFLRRNRGPVVAASLVLLALVGGVIGTTIGLVRAELARQAEEQRAEGERQAKESAEKRLGQIEKGIDVLGSIFDNIDPLAEEKDGRPLRAILGDQLDAAAAALEGDAIGDPLVVAKLQERLGKTYLGLGHARKAESLFAKSLATHRAHHGPDHALTLGSMHNLALAYLDTGKRTEAIALLEHIRDARVQDLGPEDLLTLNTLNDLARGYQLVGRKGVIELLEQVRDARVRKLGPDDPDTMATLSILARLYLDDGRKTEAIQILKQVRDARVKRGGIGDRAAIEALHNLAFAYRASYKMAESLTLYEEARDAMVLKLGADHPATLTVKHQLAWTYRATGDLPSAIALAEYVRSNRELQLGARHPATLIAIDHLAMTYRDSGNPERALPLFQQAAVGMERLKFENIEAGRIVRSLCNCQEQLGYYDEAEAWRRKWLAVVQEKAGPESPECARELTGLGLNLLEQKKYTDAEPVMRECFMILQKTKPDDWETLKAQSILGAALLGQKRYPDAEPLLRQSYQAMKDRAGARGKNHIAISARDVSVALQALIRLYDEWGNPGEAAKWRKERSQSMPEGK